jgi:hypothetical protein
MPDDIALGVSWSKSHIELISYSACWCAWVAQLCKAVHDPGTPVLGCLQLLS